MRVSSSERLSGDRGLHCTISQSGSPVPYSRIIQLWRSDAAFRSFFNASLADCSYSAFRWETPPVARKNIDRPFEYVLLNAPRLDQPGEPEAFAGHFNAARDSDLALGFPNLGGDAILVTPAPEQSFRATATSRRSSVLHRSRNSRRYGDRSGRRRCIE